MHPVVGRMERHFTLSHPPLTPTLLLTSPSFLSGAISAFLVEKTSPGVSFGAPERKMGWRSQPTASVHLDKVFVPHEAMVGQQGAGFKIAMHALDGGRINIAACR